MVQRDAKKAYQSRMQQQERLAIRYLKIGQSSQCPYYKGIKIIFQNYTKFRKPASRSQNSFRRFPSAFSRRGGERGVSSPPPASPARTARRAGCKFRFGLRKSRNCREYFLFLRKFQRLWNRNSFYTIRFPAARRSSCRWLRPVWACTSAGRRSTAILIWGTRVRP